MVRTTIRYEELRQEFYRLLTEDSETEDRRKKEFNQAIFMKNGHAVFSGTDLGMVMAKYDKAVSNVIASR